jgi:hypothetical protein
VTTMLTQFGTANESTYGTVATPTRFFEFSDESIVADNQRAESEGMRVGLRTPRADRSEPFRVGASGSVNLDVTTKGFGFWLPHMLGSIATAGPTDSNFTHTATEGALVGRFFTAQLGRPFVGTSTVQPFTYSGCKLTGWELAADLDGLLTCRLDIDARDEDTTTGLATASYPSDHRVFVWAGGSMTVGGSNVDISNFRVSADLGMDTNRRFMRSSVAKKEPLEDSMRSYEWSFTAEFDSITQFDRVRAANRAAMFAQIVATFDGPVAHGGTTLPRLQVTMPECRFDAGNPVVSGPGKIMVEFSGVARTPNSGSPMTITYRTTDTTP